MGIIITITGIQPICNECGIALCWELIQQDYEDKKYYWDNWSCKTCKPNYLRDYRRMILDTYLGISYLKDGEEEWTDEALLLWAENNCSKGNHLYDEVVTVNSHYLSCDACGNTVQLNWDGQLITNLPLDKNT